MPTNLKLASEPGAGRPSTSQLTEKGAVPPTKDSVNVIGSPASVTKPVEVTDTTGSGLTNMFRVLEVDGETRGVGEPYVHLVLTYLPHHLRVQICLGERDSVEVKRRVVGWCS